MQALILNFLKNFYLKIENKLFYQKHTRILFDKKFSEICVKKQQAFENNKDIIEVIALRGSHCDYAIIPEYFNKKVFNFGLTSMDFFGTYHLYKNISKKCNQLKYIIVFYNFAMNGFDLSKTNEKWRCAYYKTIFNIPYNTDIFRAKDLKKLDNYLKKNNKETDKSFMGYYEPDIYALYDGKKRVEGHLKNFLRNDNSLFWLEKIYQLTLEQNHTLLCVIPPFSNEFLKYLDKKYYEIALQKLQKILPKNQILDFLYDDYEPEDFGDTDHFKKNGAVKFSKRLNTILNNY
ncbi:MAG: hypothetical protein ACI37T_01880 [Candidatus Gastranaerophilaceae bacterium]